MLITDDLVLAIEPHCFRRWAETLKAHAHDVSLLAKVHSPEAAAGLIPGRKSVGDIAVVDLSGFITQKPSLFSVLFGGTSAEGLTRMVRAAMADQAIGSVVLNIDSPGGVVHGVPEAAAAIRAMRGTKPMVAVANPLAASAAYWIAAQADEIVGIPSSITGSIGAKVVHVDESAALAREGLAVTEIVYGRRKAEGTSAKPLSDEALQAIQGQVNYFGRLFEADVAKGRRVQVNTVRASYGEGSTFTADAAKNAGLIDRVATLEEVIGQLARGYKPGIRPAAASDPAEIAALAALAGIRL